MRVKVVSYERVKNLGNYQTERYKAEIELQSGDDVDEAFEAAKILVDDKLGLLPNIRDYVKAKETIEKIEGTFKIISQLRRGR